MWILLIGITSVVDVVWWIVWGMFVYIKTNAADNTMLVNSGGTAELVPIAWFWSNLNPLDTTTGSGLGFTALTYLFVFLFYLIISVPEFIFWIMYMTKADMGAFLFNLWASWVGLYGSWILYFLAFVCPLLQLVFLTNISQPGWINAVVQLVMLLISWLFTGIIHVLGFPYVNRMYERVSSAEAAAAPEEAPAEVANAADSTEEAAEEDQPEDVEEEDAEDANENDEEAEEEDEDDEGGW